MKAADRFVRLVTVIAFLTLIFAPERGSPVVLFSFAVVGVWAIFYPAGLIGWAKTAHPSLDVEDRSLWWIPRFIGGTFLGVVLLLAVNFVVKR